MDKNILEKVSKKVYEKFFKEIIKESDWKFGYKNSVYGNEERITYYMGSKYEKKIFENDTIRSNYVLITFDKTQNSTNSFKYIISQKNIFDKMKKNRFEFPKEIFNYIIQLLKEEGADWIVDNVFGEKVTLGEKSKKINEMDLKVNKNNYLVYDSHTKILNQHKVQADFGYFVDVKNEKVIVDLITEKVELTSLKEMEDWIQKIEDESKEIEESTKEVLEVYNTVMKLKDRERITSNNFILVGKRYSYNIYKNITKSGKVNYVANENNVKKNFKTLKQAKEYLKNKADEEAKKIRIKHVLKSR